MMIPYSFKLGRREFKVHHTLYLTSGCVGEIYYAPAAIKIASFNRSGKERTQMQRSETFWHETTHAILHDMNHVLRSNEKFVTEFSKRLNQVVHTARLP
jgi:hypothetical protein